MPLIKANGLNLYYELHGKGQPLVLIAGFTCDISFWNLIIKELAKHFQVLVFDNRGVGLSDNPDQDYTVEDMADDAIDLIHQLGLKRPHILGHSLGGCIAQAIARRQIDVQKIILCNSLIRFDELGAFVERTLLALRKDPVPQRRLIEAAIPWIFSRDFFTSPGRVEQFIQLRLAQPNPQTSAGFARQLNALLAFDSREWLSEIKAPTLVIHGEEDILCPRDSFELAYKIAGARLVVFSRMGHVPLIENPRECMKTIIEFLQD